jgi:haloalkane dehalogenase
MEAMMSAKSWRAAKQYAQVLGRRMAYVEQGQGDPIVLLHGNPASSFLWRSVLPELVSLGRCIAPDLIGMGDSEKLPAVDPSRYTFVRHREFLDALLDQLGVTEQVTLVLHDWGSALGFDWARRHPDRVRRIVYMEAVVRPFPDWDAWPEAARAAFQKLRSPAGDEVLLQPKLYIEDVLSAWMLRTLSNDELEEYCRPFARPGEDRLPTLMWLRQVPICGEPPEVVEVVAAYAAWLAETPGLPKLFVNAEPGAVLTGVQREFCRTWPDQTEVTVPGVHFIQEDSGKEIAKAIATWLATLASAPPKP